MGKDSGAIKQRAVEAVYNYGSKEEAEKMGAIFDPDRVNIMYGGRSWNGKHWRLVVYREIE